MVGIGSRIEEKIYSTDGSLKQVTIYKQLHFLGKGAMAKVIKVLKHSDDPRDECHFAAKVIDKALLRRKNN